jgi:outer membrane protease
MSQRTGCIGKSGFSLQKVEKGLRYSYNSMKRFVYGRSKQLSPDLCNHYFKQKGNPMKQPRLSQIAIVGLGMVLTTAVTAHSAAPVSTTQGVGATDAASPVQTTTDNHARYDLSVGAELMNGDITHQIGFPVVEPNGIVYFGHFPVSELAYPLDVWLGRVDGGATINDQWRINATIKKDVSTPSDNMEDSDWFTETNPSRLDVYSESEISSFDAFILDADIEWTFFRRQNVSVYAGLGYMYQNFDYETKALYQLSPSGLSGYDIIGDGRVSITYEITHSIPYLKLGGDLQVNPKLTFTGSVGYSPIVEVEDIDRHLLREYGGFTNEGDLDGTAFMFDISARYAFTSSLFMEGGFQLTKIEADGETVSTYGWGIPRSTITEEIDSTQTSGFLSVGYRF